MYYNFEKLVWNQIGNGWRLSIQMFRGHGTNLARLDARLAAPPRAAREEKCESPAARAGIEGRHPTTFRFCFSSSMTAAIPAEASPLSIPVGPRGALVDRWAHGTAAAHGRNHRVRPFKNVESSLPWYRLGHWKKT